MADQQRTFFVSYEGDLTSEDREALSRPGWKLYENGIGSTAGFAGDAMPPVKWRQVVRLQAAHEGEAMELVVNALGRDPVGLRADDNGPAET
jgi:hypothetical protein